MKKSVLKRTLSIVLACIMMMSIFAAIPMEAGATNPNYINLTNSYIKWTTPSTGTYTGGDPIWNFAIHDKYHGYHLQKGKDFTISYSKVAYNKTCTATIVGKGKYSGTFKYKFKVSGKSNMSSYKVTGISTINSPSLNPTYISEKVTRTVNGKTVTLKEGTDYRVTIKNVNYRAKKADVVITGIGGITGSYTKTATLTFC